MRDILKEYKKFIDEYKPKGDLKIKINRFCNKYPQYTSKKLDLYRALQQDQS